MSELKKLKRSKVSKSAASPILGPQAIRYALGKNDQVIDELEGQVIYHQARAG